ncbi:putative cell surface protein [Clostridium botulinum C str. Eklund]|nr:putative cell surface protein [Clostridium botulinum C str. Eklund]
MGAKYSVAEFPATSEATDNSNNCGGWTLAVVYTNPSLPARSISIYAGLEEITSSSPFSITSSFSKTPKLVSPKGRALLSAMHASATLGDNKVLFGPNDYNLIYLSGPRNLPNHFFGFQINDDNGNIDTSGSFGDLNQDILTGTNIVGGRQGWDITNVDVSSGLSNSQTSSTLKFITTNNNYLLNMFGLQIDIDIPKLNNIKKTVSQTFASVEDIVEYTILIPNNTTSTLNKLFLTDTLPSELSFVPDSLTIDEKPSSDSPITGVNLGNLDSFKTILVKFEARVNSEPNNHLNYVNLATVNYKVGNAPNIVSATSKSNMSKLYSSSIIVKPNINITADPTIISVDDIVEYTIKISNTQPTPIEDAILTNTLPPELSYVPNSLTINNILINSTPEATISLGTINCWQTIIIKFKATFNSRPSDVNSEYIDSANLSYTFNTIDGPLPNNITATNIITDSNASISPILVKDAVSSNPNPNIANVGDTINYTITIHNPSNKTIKNVILKDSIPNGLLIKSDSLTVNYKPTSGNIETGINLGNISPNDTVIVNYRAKAIHFSYENSANISYEFSSPNNALLNNSIIATNNIYSDNSSYVNIKPVAFNYKKIIYKNNSITGKIDSFNVNDARLKFTLYRSPQNGYADINEEGFWKYTPKVNFIGIDIFDVLIEDKNSNYSISTITIVIKNFPNSLDELDCCKKEY